MTHALRRLRHQLGGLGHAALLLLGALAVFHFAVLAPLQARNDALKARVVRQAPAASAEGRAGSAEKVGAVYEFLRRDEQATDWLAKLHAIGAATGVQLKSANYRTQQSQGRIVRYEIVLPLAGSYPQIRDFLSRSAAEIPVMSLDSLALKRENRNQPRLQAELRITLHMVAS